MELRYWPPEHAENPAFSVIHKVLEQLRSADPQLWALATERLREAERPAMELTDFTRRGWAERMRYTRNALYEMKLPVQRKKGVFRVYFCCDPIVRNRIWLLEAEHKVGSGEKQHKAIVDRADDRSGIIRREGGQG